MDYEWVDIPQPCSYPKIVVKKREKDLPIKKQFEYNPIGSFRDAGNPYDIAFCYPHPLYHRPFIVKGGHQQNLKYLRSLNIPMVVHHTMYRRKIHRRIISLYCIDRNISIHKDIKFDIETGEYAVDVKFNLVRYVTTKDGKRNKEVLARFKRIPRRWIRELNLYITTERRSFHDGSVSGTRKTK